MTKQELQEYYWTKRNIEKLEQRLEELRSMAEKITMQVKQYPDSIHGKGQTTDRVGNLVAEMESVEDEIRESMKDSLHMLRQIETAIRKLPAREMYLIRARYIEHHSWEQVCVDMNYSWRQMHRIHSDALKELAKDGTK